MLPVTVVVPDPLACYTKGMDLAELLDLIDLRADGVADTFLGRSPRDRERSVYGGQFLAQALVAAARTVPEGRVPNSIHAQFVRAGDPRIPISYHVERIRDGRSFNHRLVVATQDGKEVFRQFVMLCAPAADGAHHVVPGPVEVGCDPATMPSYRDWLQAGSSNPANPWFAERTPADARFENAPPIAAGSRPAFVLPSPQRMWLRVEGAPVGDDPLVHAALLAWLSDKTLSDCTVLTHGAMWTDEGVDTLSLDHAMWFLRPVRADDWILLVQDTPSTGAGRGLARGEFYDRNGTLVAHAVQEALVLLGDRA